MMLRRVRRVPIRQLLMALKVATNLVGSPTTLSTGVQLNSMDITGSMGPLLDDNG